jgi:Protein of unknown function (DUF2442)
MARRTLTDREILSQLPAARTRARSARAQGPRARRAYYDRERKLVVVELTNGAVFAFPPRLAQGLRGASAETLAEIEVSPSGEALHWDRLDADLRVPALLQGMFGTRTWMRQLGQAGGRVRSQAKARAARANGAKGGRPRSART